MQSFEEFDQPTPTVSDPSPRRETPPSPAPGIAKIAAALARAQAEFVQPTKNKSVTVRPKDGKPPYTFEYADYNAIVEAVRGPLSKNGICFTHLIMLAGDRGLILKTMLIHDTGEVLESFYPLGSPMDPKALGAEITYGKRYSLSAITGCVADDDVDADPENTTNFGNNPNARQPAQAQQAGPTAASPSKQGPSDAQVKRLFAIASSANWTHEQIKLYMGLKWKIDSTSKLNREQYDFICNTMPGMSFKQACAELATAAAGQQEMPR